MKTQKEVVQKVIDWSVDNSSGIILSKTAIKKVISECYKDLSKCDIKFVDNLIAENESTRHGFLVETYDILHSLPKESEWDDYMKLLDKTQKELERLQKDFDEDRIKSKNYNNNCYECLSRYVNMCRANKWTTKPKYDEMVVQIKNDKGNKIWILTSRFAYNPELAQNNMRGENLSWILDGDDVELV